MFFSSLTVAPVSCLVNGPGTLIFVKGICTVSGLPGAASLVGDCVSGNWSLTKGMFDFNLFIVSVVNSPVGTGLLNCWSWLSSTFLKVLRRFYPA